MTPSTPPLARPKLGYQLAAHGFTSDPEVIASLNSLDDPGYLLTRGAISVAERILHQSGNESSVDALVTLSTREQAALAGLRLGVAIGVLSRQPTLIVNAIAHAATLDHAFGATRSQGLAGVIHSSVSWRSCVIATKLPGISFLPFGSAEEFNPTSLTAQALGKFSREACTDFPRILILAPSLREPESPSLLLCSDRIGGIAWQGETREDEVAEFMATCDSLGKPQLGMILARD